jgi:hypothetical protein
VTTIPDRLDGGRKLPAGPARSRGLLSDIRYFFLHKPAVQTLIDFATAEDKKEYSHRIMQRLDINVEQYRILNIHQIGINAPVQYVHEELLKWGLDSICWPNHIATVGRADERLEHIEIFLFGQNKYLSRLKNRWLGSDFIPLFNLDAIKFQHSPEPADVDNARYLLYRCSGGYPIGIFSIYVRSPIREEGETEQAQLFFTVGFNFYGHKDWSDNHIVNKVWEKVHNRVTANILNRIKQYCEGLFQEVMNGFHSPPG